MKSPSKKSSGANPLAGVRVLVGRARHQASALSAELRELGAEVIEIPFIEIRKARSYEPLDAALKAIANYDWLILTSVNGVEALSARMKRLRISAAGLKHLKIAAIGPATREEIEKLGLKVAVVPQRYIAEAVVESLQGKVAGKRVLLARARVARDVIPRELRKMGARVDVAEAYETVAPAGSRTRLRSVMKNPRRRPHLVTFTSSSTVKNFIALTGWRGRPLHPRLEGIQFASIGPITSATLREYNLTVDVEAMQFTIPGLIRAIGKRYAR